jgi:hypothetical protein
MNDETVIKIILGAVVCRQIMNMVDRLTALWVMAVALDVLIETIPRDRLQRSHSVVLHIEIGLIGLAVSALQTPVTLLLVYEPDPRRILIAWISSTKFQTGLPMPPVVNRQCVPRGMSADTYPLDPYLLRDWNFRTARNGSLIIADLQVRPSHRLAPKNYPQAREVADCRDHRSTALTHVTQNLVLTFPLDGLDNPT